MLLETKWGPEKMRTIIQGMEACDNILGFTTAVNLPADNCSEFVEESLGERR
jgi:hypothetical protein